MLDSIILYEGKAKRVHLTNEPNVLRLEYLDQATALNGKKKTNILGKGRLNNLITSEIFDYLTEAGITHHFIKKISDSEQLVEKVTIIPLEVVVRNNATGSFTKRLGIQEGTKLPTPIIEFYYKNDELDDPFINDEHIYFLELATASELDRIKAEALKINTALITLFQSIGITLVDFKIEFGRTITGDILLSDEISPDTCRLWDNETGHSLDKDIFRKDLGELVPLYTTVLERLTNR